jgi:hypothetical protein
MNGKIMWNESESQMFSPESELVVEMNSDSTAEFVKAIRKSRILNWKRKYFDNEIIRE